MAWHTSHRSGRSSNTAPQNCWRKGFWLECEPQGLSAVIRAEGPDSEENELQIDVYAQSEEFEYETSS